MKSFIWLLPAFQLLGRSVAQQSGSIVPLYIYPQTSNGTFAWQPLVDAYKKHPIRTYAVINVHNGPGDAMVSDYAKGISQLHHAGIKTLGYVHTQYGRRSVADVRGEIDRWRSLYKLDGIFLEQMAYDDNQANVNYYRDLNNYAKQQGFTFTVGSPGASTLPRYFDTVDAIIIYHDPGVPTRDRICSQGTNGKGRASVGITSYKVQNLVERQVRDVKECGGYIYITDDEPPNQWKKFPSYLTRLFRLLKN